LAFKEENYSMPFLQKIKITLLELFRSPVPTTARVFHKLFSVFKRRQIERLRETTSHSPLMLQIETTNVCNAACIFCAYPGMKREKGVMSMPLFERIVKEYAEMGGSAVSLTPVVGDALLDPHLLERLRILKAHPAIRQITLTTNGIALEKYSDEEVRSLLESLSCIQVSIGGLDRATYKAMYGTDRFVQVQAAMERLLALKTTVSIPANITFAFRTNDWKFTRRFRKQLSGYRQQGVDICHMWAYANYGGQVETGAKIGLTIVDSQPDKQKTCIFPRIHAAVCWDGTVTACACTDLECRQLKIGHIGEEALSGILSGEKRTRILDSFGKDALVDICRKCSAYQPDTDFADPCFDGVHPNKPLPLDFFRNKMT
jgi:MoaA/NifB/PqqE/SkfB family radical SAM enzyme